MELFLSFSSFKSLLTYLNVILVGIVELIDSFT